MSTPGHEKSTPQSRQVAPHLQSAAFDQHLLQLSGRIDNLIDEENRVLATATPDELDRFVERKCHLALEASRIAQHIAGHVPGPEVKDKFRQTVEKLSQNATQVRRHIVAVEEITAMLADLHSNSTSDGTYTISVSSRIMTK
jgi:Zn-dependent oligopeptidase